MTTVVPEQTAVAVPPVTSAPRPWSFISNVDGALMTVTCLQGCEMDHSHDIETPTNPEDIWCQTISKDVELPVNTNGQPEDIAVLSWTLNVRPFDRTMNARLPHACVEMMRDSWIEDLDPDAFEAVIDTLEKRVKGMRQAHADLVRTRAEYRARQH
ncbi:DUF6907 domain-containing protein [Streptomyces sp. NBC_01794]|uniref:DUF6907 domain-containing protein n=1 Tax=Streptomyces sp. NBC_01794 TaxID=2975942 RepID=UPI0030896E50|nr:hypothetical protein OIE54_12130 [Streptomyces sp. NBC_01794]